MAPVAITALAVAVKLNDGTSTSSPDLIPKDNNDAYKAEVPEFTATAYLQSSNSDNCFSKIFTYFPPYILELLSKPLSRIVWAIFTSLSSNTGSLTEIFLDI